MFAKGALLSISIHALRVEGDVKSRCTLAHVGISIHALRVEGDEVWAAACVKIHTISIHALRVEGDL